MRLLEFLHRRRERRQAQVQAELFEEQLTIAADFAITKGWTSSDYGLDQPEPRLRVTVADVVGRALAFNYGPISPHPAADALRRRLEHRGWAGWHMVDTDAYDPHWER